LAELEFADGPYFFPVTPFAVDGSVDVAALRSHVATGVEAGAGAVFAACGTGEFHALSFDEHAAVVAETVAEAAGRVPVIAGAGGPLGHALATAAAARSAGADGLLVMPPYLVQGPQAGLVAYVTAIADAAQLPVIVYHRATSQLTPETVATLLANPAIVGIKDGVGDVALTQRFVLEARRSGRDVLFFNGLLTAEMSQAAYRAIGVPLYSSAVFAMAPDIAMAFYRAYQAQDEEAQSRLLAGFYAPLVALRDEVPGFAVSLIKAGLRLAGEPVGSVRAPLVDPTAEQESRLGHIIEQGRALL